MKSFLENIDDKVLTWNKEEDDNDNSDFSSDDDSSLDDDSDDDDNNNDDDNNDDDQNNNNHERNHNNNNNIIDIMDENDSVDGEGGAHQAQQENNNNNNDGRQDAGFVFVEFDDIDEEHQQQQQQQQLNNAPERVLAQQVVEGDNDGRNNNVQGNAPLPQQQQQQQQQTTSTRSRVSVARVIENLSNHSQHQQLICRVARSEQHPLVRADIDWDLLKTQLHTYPATDVGDYAGGVLLQGILRMDPPYHVVQETLNVFPRSCIDMDCFFAACQYSSTSTSTNTTSLSSLQNCDFEPEKKEQSVVQLIMRHTMETRHKEGIQWGMLAFLGDARLTTKHAELLLQSIPGAVTDPSHGIFGVSPLDRMLSGAFIHGNDTEWVEKVKLALWTAEFGSVHTECPSSSLPASSSSGKAVSFYPFHALVRRLVSPDFMGVQFGAFTFIRTLIACMRSGKCCRVNNRDNQGRLPIHVALEEECQTRLGTAGERKLIKFFVQEQPESISMGNKHGIQPLRLAIQNGWPVYDLILDTIMMSQRQQPQSSTQEIGFTTCSRDSQGNLPIHIALGGAYHPSFGVAGAREIVRYILKKSPQSAQIPNGKGTLPLHLALQYGWPCHDILVSAAPQALETRHIQTGFYPFQIAASCASSVWHATTMQKEQNNKNNAGGNYDQIRDAPKDLVSLRALSVLYELIREAPLLTHGLASSTTTNVHDTTDTDQGNPMKNDKSLEFSTRKKRKLLEMSHSLPQKEALLE